MRRLALLLAVLLCGAMASGDALQRKTAASAVPCVPNTLVIVTDDAAGGDCAGGGAVDSLCQCSDDGTSLEAPGAPHDSKTDHEGRYGLANVEDYGAACDLYALDGGLLAGKPADPTDDGVAIQAAIDAVEADPAISDLFFPRACYTTTKILWKRSVGLIGSNTSGLGNQAGAGGIYCGHGMNDNCVETSHVTNDFHYSRIKDFNIRKPKYCSEDGVTPCVFGGGGCTCTNGSTDTIGSGLVFVDGDYAGESTYIENIDIENFPEFGMELQNGTTGWGHFTGIGLFNNGYAAPITGTATSIPTNNELTDTGAFAGLDLVGWYVTITSGTGVGQVRRIAAHDDNTLNLGGITWSTDPVGSDYSIDSGGGILVRTGATALAGCSFDTISGDGNSPALIHVSDGAGGEHIGGGPHCAFRNIKSEAANNSGGYQQEHVLRLTNSGVNVLLEGVNHSDRSPYNNAIIYFDGKACPREVTYSGLGIAQAGRDDYLIIDSSGVDPAACQITIGGTTSPNQGPWTHEGAIPNAIYVEPTSADPFACSTHWRGNRYFNTTLAAWLGCNGTAWTAGTSLQAADELCLGDGDICIRYDATSGCGYLDVDDDNACDSGEELSANCTACP